MTPTERANADPLYRALIDAWSAERDSLLARAWHRASIARFYAVQDAQNPPRKPDGFIDWDAYKR